MANILIKIQTCLVFSMDLGSKVDWADEFLSLDPEYNSKIHSS